MCAVWGTVECRAECGRPGDCTLGSFEFWIAGAKEAVVAVSERVVADDVAACDECLRHVRLLFDGTAYFEEGASGIVRLEDRCDFERVFAVRAIVERDCDEATVAWAMPDECTKPRCAGRGCANPANTADGRHHEERGDRDGDEPFGRTAGVREREGHRHGERDQGEVTQGCVSEMQGNQRGANSQDGDGNERTRRTRRGVGGGARKEEADAQREKPGKDVHGAGIRCLRNHQAASGHGEHGCNANRARTWAAPAEDRSENEDAECCGNRERRPAHAAHGQRDYGENESGE